MLEFVKAATTTTTDALMIICTDNNEHQVKDFQMVAGEGVTGSLLLDHRRGPGKLCFDGLEVVDLQGHTRLTFNIDTWP